MPTRPAPPVPLSSIKESSQEDLNASGRSRSGGSVGSPGGGEGVNKIPSVRRKRPTEDEDEYVTPSVPARKISVAGGGTERSARTLQPASAHPDLRGSNSTASSDDSLRMRRQGIPSIRKTGTRNSNRRESAMNTTPAVSRPATTRTEAPAQNEMAPPASTETNPNQDMMAMMQQQIQQMMQQQQQQQQPQQPPQQQPPQGFPNPMFMSPYGGFPQNPFQAGMAGAMMYPAVGQQNMFPTMNPHFQAPVPAFQPVGQPAAKVEEELPAAVLTAIRTIESKPVVLFAEASSEVAGRCRSVQKILSNLGVDVDNEMAVYTLDSRNDGPVLHRHLARITGYDSVPVLFVGGRCMGDYQAILAQCRTDQLRPKLMDAGVKSVVSAIPTTTLEENIFGYPKALAAGQRRANEGGAMNVLVACCGSSASDKIPELVERCVQAGWSVKLVCTSSGEHFFKTFGMQRVINAIGAENIYRDEDEWSFEYEQFDMPVRACHLAIRKWADIMVVAPVTCNTMAKAAAGIGDNLLSSILVAWEYHKKPIFLCPACNADMWNNFPTQRNVKTLKSMGVEILGPRVDRLTNGQVAIGCMEKVDKIMERLGLEEETMLSGSAFFFNRARQASTEDNDQIWQLVLRGVEEGVMDANAQMEGNGNTLLHFAAGGESFALEGGVRWGKPDLYPLERLLQLGANPNVANNYQFKPLHVAISTGDAAAVQILLDAGADATGTLIDFPNVSQGIRDMLATKKEAAELVTPYYYTYGSLKRGFPNHENLAHHLKNFTGNAKTVENFPLVIPNVPFCANPNCPYLHQQATLCDLPGKGKQVIGEVFEVTAQDIEAFDRLEGYNGGNVLDNVYSRKLVDVDVDGLGLVKAYVYFTSNSEDAMALVEAGDGQFITKYEMHMAKGAIKPGYEDPEKNKAKISRRTSIRSLISTASGVGVLVTPSRGVPFVSSAVSALSNTSGHGGRGNTHDHDHDHGHSHSHSHSGEPPNPEYLDSESPVMVEAVKEKRKVPSRVSSKYDAVVNENAGTIQQAINTCNVAAITMALKSLGVNCPMDEIFSALRLPTSWVVEAGLTLAQVYNLLTKLCGSQRPSECLAPGLVVECYHFDEEFADFDKFVQFLRESIGDEDDVLIGNFSTKIARDMAHGGGHFSLISGYSQRTGLVSIADVHPQKYGANWTCSAEKLFEAMTDKDSGIGRSRGMIRVAYKNALSISCLDNCRSAISFFDTKLQPELRDWLARWGDLPAVAFESHLNMGGLSSLGLLLSGFLSDEDYASLCLPGQISADYLAWNLRLSITSLLGTLISPRSLTNYARRACDKLDLDLRIVTELAETETPISLFEWFEDRVGPRHFTAAMVLLDLNAAFGANLMNTVAGSEASVLDHGAQHWCCVVGTNGEEEIIIADPRAKTMTRLWKCSPARLRDGMLRATKDPGRVVLVGNQM